MAYVGICYILRALFPFDTLKPNMDPQGLYLWDVCNDSSVMASQGTELLGRTFRKDFSSL